ncbi:hypothetical protein LEP1GSC047_0239 [Leptospira inadai serovar Lyme str. 10]|uniref:Uncharacterized protein n=1 Tax=Leptospira inadai serovar Lyme str. 10 TaxID=1049790 RepID=V6H9S5_9LEPT|nr:hypothetical protein LEP1GSC047_0239 [Leptospira inadai serovar Lyme str. 10]
MIFETFYLIKKLVLFLIFFIRIGTNPAFQFPEIFFCRKRPLSNAVISKIQTGSDGVRFPISLDRVLDCNMSI